MCNDAIAALDHVRTSALQRESAVDCRAPADDLCMVPVPTHAVLVGEEHQIAALEPGVPAGVVKQHQHQQAVHLRMFRHQLGEWIHPVRELALVLKNSVAFRPAGLPFILGNHVIAGSGTYSLALINWRRVRLR